MKRESRWLQQDYRRYRDQTRMESARRESNGKLALVVAEVLLFKFPTEVNATVLFDVALTAVEALEDAGVVFASMSSISECEVESDG